MRIDFTVLDGNLGDGFADNYAAANAFAQFTAEKLHTEFPSATICSDVRRNTTGAGHDLTVTMTDEEMTDQDGEYDSSLERHATEIADAILERAWEQFCSSPEALSL